MKRLIGIGIAGIVACAVLAGGSASAQQPAAPGAPAPSGEFGPRAPAPPPAPRPELGLEPTQPPEEAGVREQEFYPGYLIRSRHEPAFVRPFVGTFATSESTSARVGLSGWTAPALPYDTPSETGGVAFGLTIVWGVPRPGSKPPEPAPAAGQR